MHFVFIPFVQTFIYWLLVKVNWCWFPWQRETQNYFYSLRCSYFSVFGTVVKCLHLPFYLKHFECLPDHGHQCRRHHYHSSRSCQFVTVQCALFSYLLQHIATYAILVLTSSTSGVLTQHEEPRELTDCYQRFTSPHNNETYKFPSRADMHAHCLDQFMWKRDRIRWADFNITDKDFDFIRSLSITVGYNTYKPKAIFL